MSSKGSVLVAMSGGVDSSVAACLLLEAGYEVLGSHLKLVDTGAVEHGCCGPKAEADARAKGCVLSGLVPSGASKADDSPPSATPGWEPVRRPGVTLTVLPARPDRGSAPRAGPKPLAAGPPKAG